MQHSALCRRTTPAVMRHRVEAAKSSAAPRLPFPSTAQTVTGLSEPFFVSPPQPVVLFVAFTDASQQLSSALPLPPLSRHSATIHSAAASPGACGANGHDRKRRHVAHPSRSRREVPPEKGGHRTKTHPLFRDFPQLFRASPVHGPMHPDNATISPPHSVFAGENTVRSHVFCLQICIFAHSSLSLRRYMSAKLRTLRRQVALAWILLLALLPQLVVKTFHYHDSAVPTEHIGLNAGGQGAECLACLHATAAATARDGQHAGKNGTPAPALAHRTHRPCHRHHHLPGQVPGDKHDNCSICHFVPAPCTVPTLPQFCFFVSTAETPFLSDQPSIAHTVIARAVLRGPPTV